MGTSSLHKMRRPRPFRREPRPQSGWSMIEQMAEEYNHNHSKSDDVQQPQELMLQETTQTDRRITVKGTKGRDTGFPEGFCGNRNTSLPHPKANLSPDASIGEEDIAVTRALARHRMSFIAKKDKQHHHLDRASGLMGTSLQQYSHHLPHLHLHLHKDDHHSSSQNQSQPQQQIISTPEKRIPNDPRLLLMAGKGEKGLGAIGKLALTTLHGAELQRHMVGPPPAAAESKPPASSDVGDGMSTTGSASASEAGGDSARTSRSSSSSGPSALMGDVLSASPVEISSAEDHQHRGKEELDNIGFSLPEGPERRSSTGDGDTTAAAVASLDPRDDPDRGLRKKGSLLLLQRLMHL
ncbi:hypothetical protein B0H66DRAFT_154771 [Apodospora peruviana]|uniref:Uncharacterized protein n=1 Tax=Apodospora peruviana TaxID=516989 RepID=A0AAE0IJP4_9PEZI|nr:hypothetical protein B0H66DRAFT_154771 [Apodospora peruviana]